MEEGDSQRASRSSFESCRVGNNRARTALHAGLGN
jgi:hypothetical protein